MAQEIERKFLVAGDGWRQRVSATRKFRQAYLAATDTQSTRVRIVDGESARLTIKSARAGMTRDEFEYDIPLADAEALIGLRVGTIIEKTRHLVEASGLTFEVDVFEGAHAGLVIAEVELPAEDHDFDLPDWIGDEVTEDRRYYNSDLALGGTPRGNGR